MLRERLIAVVMIVVLALDVSLPVPSSVVSTTAGTLLDFWIGAIVSTPYGAKT
jgi:uncharacterized membrane protein YdjX (TVP38/TMEM64 family)